MICTSRVTSPFVNEKLQAKDESKQRGRAGTIKGVQLRLKDGHESSDTRSTGSQQFTSEKEAQGTSSQRSFNSHLEFSEIRVASVKTNVSSSRKASVEKNSIFSGEMAMSFSHINHALSHA